MTSLADEIRGAADVLQGVSPDEWYDVLDDRNEALGACLRGLAETDPDRGLEIAALVVPYWIARGRLAEGRGWLDELLSRTSGAPRTVVRAKAWYGAGMIAFLQDDAVTARHLLGDSLAVGVALADRTLEADALIGLARVAMIDGDPLTMEQLARECADAARAAHDERRLGTALHHVAEALRRQTRFAEGLPVYRCAVRRHRALGDRRSVALELHNVGRLFRQTGDPRRAEDRFRASLEIAVALRHERLVGYCLLGLANLASDRGDHARALRLVGASDSLFAAVGAALDPEYSVEREQVSNAARRELGEPRSDEEYRTGRMQTAEGGVRAALQAA